VKLASPWLLVALLPALAVAHELRPAYLGVTETGAGEYHVLWKTPRLGDLQLALEPDFGDDTTRSAVTRTTPPGASVEEWTLHAPDLAGRTVTIRGLEATMTDALVRIDRLDGSSCTLRLRPAEPSAVIPARPGRLGVAAAYGRLGVEHILTGFDHLLFVLALILIARGGWRVVRTATAFTVSHGLTLTAATLGYVHVPPAPVEATIALSIVFVARELYVQVQGRPSLTARAPWLVALSFGLLHGLGFAGALSEAGLPASHVPLALLFFSVGVEVGHVLFIAAVLALLASGRRLRVAPPRWARLAPACAIGAVASFWLFQRLSTF